MDLFTLQKIYSRELVTLIHFTTNKKLFEIYKLNIASGLKWPKDAIIKNLVYFIA
jgi:hypothetical protein